MNHARRKPRVEDKGKAVGRLEIPDEERANLKRGPKVLDTEESVVFTRDYVQTLIDGANVQAVSISSITQSSTGVVDEPPPPFTEHAEPPSLTDELDLAKMKLTSEGQAQTDIPDTEDIISLAETDLPSTSIADDPAELGTNVGLWSPLKEDDSTLWLPISTSNSLETQKQIDATCYTAIHQNPL
ncbi:hypothetical protein EPUS_07934 [Endocarpon pusillum Z07020]|uniref:Uncharacterized protein n=1 Tax=Endocarpon pusillum (strain Z07020 / HMAS-L-300199) TaxID=1263415 RepID=U1GWZ8_ENDPU|nr:uncharacterized protein EPUS_07934 [Endocarpon pusillum Z07020]ERF77028.1 hypothetical protein EPUS_07934 [Endocarpon pusillum Z07020]